VGGAERQRSSSSSKLSLGAGEVRDKRSDAQLGEGTGDRLKSVGFGT